MRTLAEMNRNRREFTGKSGELLTSQFAIGTAGQKRTGEKLHLIVVYRKVSDGSSTGAYVRCGIQSSRGYGTAHEAPGLETDALTCSRCIKRVAGGAR